jgi:16S rRNA (cytidine1402-2'-O)-methyltransferase
LSTLEDMQDILGDRPAAVCRELTKVHEEVCRDLLSALYHHFNGHQIRGEMVIVVSGYLPPPPAEVTLEEAAQEVIALINQGGNKKEALKNKASQYGLKKSDLYKTVEEMIAND